LWASTKAVLYWHDRSRESWSAETPLAALTKMHTAASRSTKAILREAKMVPKVAENCLPQARHFHLRRVARK
jgi:hypothetical protein